MNKTFVGFNILIASALIAFMTVAVSNNPEFCGVGISVIGIIIGIRLIASGIK